MTHLRLRHLPVFLFALMTLSGVPGHALAAGEQAGVAAAVHGQVQIVTIADQVGRQVSSGEPIFLGDRISSGPDSGLQILLLDETVFTIGPESALEIDQFVYDPNTDVGKVGAQVVKGTFRFISGKIAANKPSDMTVNLPNGTIGIRGTIVAGRVDPAQSMVVLLGPGASNNAAERVGEIAVGNAGTVVNITRSGWGTTIGADGIPAPPAPVPVEVIDSLTKSLKADDGKKEEKNNDNGNDNGDGKGEGKKDSGQKSSNPGNAKNDDGKGDKKGKTEQADKGAGKKDGNPGEKSGGNPGGNPGGGLARLGGDMNRMAGQTAAAGLGFSLDNQRLDTFTGRLDETTEQASQDFISTGTERITSIEELLRIQTGQFHFAGTAPFFLTAVANGTYASVVTGTGKLNSAFNIDFGARTLGGGSSHFQIRDANNLFIDEALIKPILYNDNTGDFGDSLAKGNFTASDFTATGNSVCATCFAGSEGSIWNTPDRVAGKAILKIKFDNAGTTLGTGVVSSPRVGGLSPAPPAP